MKKQLAKIAAVSLMIQICLAAEESMPRGYTIPTIDLSKQTHRQVKPSRVHEGRMHRGVAVPHATPQRVRPPSPTGRAKCTQGAHGGPFLLMDYVCTSFSASSGAYYIGVVLNRTNGAIMSTTPKKVRPFFFAYQNIAVITPSRPPWKDIPPVHTLNR